jgi:hypothetical protein
VDSVGYRKVFRDIVKGSSEVTIGEDVLYIKHLSSLDQVDIDEVRSKYLEKALSRGIPSEKELVDSLKKDGTWTDEDDAKIKRQYAYIEQLQKGKTQMVLKSQLDKQNENIQKAKKELLVLENKRAQLIGINAESYADKRSNDYYIIKSFYKDKDCENPVFENENDYNELYAEELAQYINSYNLIFKDFEELNIQRMILQDFYYIYFPFSDDTVGFFGRPVVELTYNQLKLIVYTKIFKNIFESNSHIPEKIKKDPEALLDYGSVSSDAKAKMQEKINKDSDGSTLFNATDEDYEYAGLDKPSEKAGISLHKAAEKKGGSLSMQDLMELSGIPRSK